MLDLALLSLALHGEIDMFWSFLSVLIVHIGESVVTLIFVLSRSKQLQFGLAVSELTKQLSEEALPATYSGLIITAYAHNTRHPQEECPDFQINGGKEYTHCFDKEASVILGVASILGWYHLLRYLKGTKIGGATCLQLNCATSLRASLNDVLSLLFRFVIVICLLCFRCHMFVV